MGQEFTPRNDREGRERPTGCWTEGTLFNQPIHSSLLLCSFGDNKLEITDEWMELSLAVGGSLPKAGEYLPGFGRGKPSIPFILLMVSFEQRIPLHFGQQQNEKKTLGNRVIVNFLSSQSSCCKMDKNKNMNDGKCIEMIGWVQ